MITNPDVLRTMSLLASALREKNQQAGQQTLIDLTHWQETKKELEDQAVLPLAIGYVMQAELSEEEKLSLVKRTALNLRGFHKLMSAQTSLVKLLEAQQIPCAILKGAAAAQYYPEPELRSFGDIDVLVLPEHFDKALKVLTESAYELVPAHTSDRHTGLNTPTGVSVELHRFFSLSLNYQEKDVLNAWLFEQLRLFDRHNWKKVGDYDVPVFPDVENGLVILEHINQHLSSGLGLRQIVDWMMYVRTKLDDEAWNQRFGQRTEAIGMTVLAKTVTKMCQMYLGLDSGITWCKDADEALSDELLLYIFHNGNFGRKHDMGTTHKITTVLHCFANPANAYHYLTEGGMQHMGQAGLKPRKSVAWLYQIGHLLRMGIKHDDTLDFKAITKSATQETELLRKLKVTR